MSSEKQVEFTKDNIDTYLKEVAKEYRKRIGKNMPAELILIGGASVLINYGFRDMTTDIDLSLQSSEKRNPNDKTQYQICSPCEKSHREYYFT